MIKILQVGNVDSFVESRRQKTSEKDRKIVQSILNDVRKNGDSAVKKYERKFNGRKTSQLRVSAKEIKEAQSKISVNERLAILPMTVRLNFNDSKIRVLLEDLTRKFNQLQTADKLRASNDKVSKSFIPIPSVGCYVPGGQA